jgi:hypothetical protein
MTITLPLETINPILSSLTLNTTTDELKKILISTSELIKENFSKDSTLEKSDVQAYAEIRDFFGKSEDIFFLSDKELSAKFSSLKFIESSSYIDLQNLEDSLSLLKKNNPYSPLINSIEEQIQTTSEETCKIELTTCLYRLLDALPCNVEEHKGRTNHIKSIAKKAGINLDTFEFEAPWGDQFSLVVYKRETFTATQALEFDYVKVATDKILDVLDNNKDISQKMYIQIYKSVKYCEDAGFKILDLSLDEILDKLEPNINKDICNRLDELFNVYKDETYFKSIDFIYSILDIAPPGCFYKNSLIGFNYNGITLNYDDIVTLVFSSLIHLQENLVLSPIISRDGMYTGFTERCLTTIYKEQLTQFNCSNELKNQYLKSMIFILLNKVKEQLSTAKYDSAINYIYKGVKALIDQNDELSLESLGISEELYNLMSNAHAEQFNPQDVFDLVPSKAIPFDINYSVKRSMLSTHTNVRNIA